MNYAVWAPCVTTADRQSLTAAGRAGTAVGRRPPPHNTHIWVSPRVRSPPTARSAMCTVWHRRRHGIRVFKCRTYHQICADQRRLGESRILLSTQLPSEAMQLRRSGDNRPMREHNAIHSARRAATAQNDRAIRQLNGRLKVLEQRTLGELPQHLMKMLDYAH
jgi:hypothetical protein